jgi:hypothetical protein
VLEDESEDHGLSLAKNFVANFKISRSCAPSPEGAAVRGKKTQDFVLAFEATDFLLEALLLAWRMRACRPVGVALGLVVLTNPFAEGAESHAEIFGDDSAGFVAFEGESHGVLFEFGGVFVLLFGFAVGHDHSVL